MANTFVKFVLVVMVAVVTYRWLPLFKQKREDAKVTTKEANALLKEHSKIYGTPHVEKVTDHVYVAIGYAIANMIMLEGDDGIIIVDTTESPTTARRAFKELRKITKKPLKGIILTHFHTDHITGMGALLDAEETKGVAIFTHESTSAETLRFIKSGDISYLRGTRQFGANLEPEKEHIDSGIGPRLFVDLEEAWTGPTATHTYKNKLEYSLAGINFTLIHTPGETDDQTTVWIPDWGVVLPADNIYEAFPNLYAIRGSPPRDCKTWFQSLDKVRRLGAKFMVPSHTRPVEGEDKIFDIITHYRDAIQFVHDQTILYMNEGFEVDEIVEKVRLPPSLASHPYLQEYYGQVSWSVRAVYDLELGWFDGDPVNLHPLSKQTRADRMLELLNSDFGSANTGVEKLLLKAKECADKSSSHFSKTGYILREDLQWSLELSFLAMKTTEPGSASHNDAKKTAVKALLSLGVATVNANARNYYLTYAKELETGLIVAITRKGYAANIDALKIEEIMTVFELRFNAEICDDTELLTIIIEFNDVEQVHSYTMRHCILEHNTERNLIPNDFDAKLSLTSVLWKDLIKKERSAVAAYASGEIVIEGSMLSFKRFMGFIKEK